MSVWKRTWQVNDGKGGKKERHAFVANYYDADGDRHIMTFRTKQEATAYLARVKGDLADGTHVAPHKSATVKAATERWLAAAETDGLERATLKQYREHVNQHIVPLIGSTKLCHLTTAAVRRFEDRLCEEGRSPAMRRKIIGSLGSVLAESQEQGLCAHNAVRELSKKRRRKRSQNRHARNLEAGTHFPRLEEVKAITGHAKGIWQPLLKTAAVTGLRASELRGLRWRDVHFDSGKIHVRQRADRFNEIGSPKSESSQRSVPMPGSLQTALKAWRLKRTAYKRNDDLVFGNGDGNPESLANMQNASEGTIKETTYWWPRPGSDEPFEKRVFYTKVSDQICAVGYYEE